MTEWFDREPGSPVAQGKDDPTMLLVGGNKPDWVRLPRELGGAKAKVLDILAGPCPKCDGETVKHFVLDLDVGVAECPKEGFLWYATKGG